DLLMHHGCHFRRTVHAFCNVQMLLMNGIVLLSEGANNGLEFFPAMEQKEFKVFHELLCLVPGLEAHLMESSEEEISDITDLVCFPT
ncbi:hypothetical protein SCLCIDRAFT_146313, partial [Scleroderma citrinum Foug A]